MRQSRAFLFVISKEAALTEISPVVEGDLSAACAAFEMTVLFLSWIATPPMAARDDALLAFSWLM